MKRAGGVGDLQKGERRVPASVRIMSSKANVVHSYCNMDYIFHLSTRDSGVIMLVVLYDIACQWHKNFYQRMMDFPHEFKFDGDEMLIIFLVPKFHLPAHIDECQLQFSFNYT
jgi:Kyakuja-Dileera-Zisupton transposase